MNSLLKTCVTERSVSPSCKTVSISRGRHQPEVAGLRRPPLTVKLVGQDVHVADGGVAESLRVTSLGYGLPCRLVLLMPSFASQPLRRPRELLPPESRTQLFRYACISYFSDKP